MQSRGSFQQQVLFKGRWSHRWSHGGELRRQRAGRNHRPISTKWPLHVVFKCEKRLLPKGFRAPNTFRLTVLTMQQYAARFFVRIEQFSVQHDHIHIMVRTTRRSNLINFMRVFSGQVAQRLENSGIMKARVTDTPAGSLVAKAAFWKNRPFTRIVLGRNAWRVLREYIQLNEAEALGILKYQKRRLRGLTPLQRLTLWTVETIQKINVFNSLQFSHSAALTFLKVKSNLNQKSISAEKNKDF